MEDRLEKALATYVESQLKPAGLSDAQIVRVKDGLARLVKLGVKPTSVFPVGIIVNDGAVVHADLDGKGLGDLVAGLGQQPGGAIERFEVFPKGIIAVDGFSTRIRVR
jgi:hypothetical protein